MSDAPTQSLTRTARVWNFGDNVGTDLIMPGAIFVEPRDANATEMRPRRSAE
jgi:hypothetical protein